MVLSFLNLIIIFAFVCPSYSQYQRLKQIEYFIGDVVGSFDEASAKCDEDGANLVTVKTEELHNFLINLIGINTLNAPYAFYLGLKRHADENVDASFKWEEDGNVLSKSFSKWANGYPSSKTAKCVLMGLTTTKDSTFSWRDYACFTEARYICERIVSHVRLLQDGFYHILGSYEYYFGDSVENYGAAERECASRAGSLAVLVDKEMYDFAATEIGFLDITIAPYSFYIGLKRFSEWNTNNAFSWIGGISAGTGYLKWASGQPDNSEEKCVTLGHRTPSGAQDYDLRDVVCSSIAKYICQRGYSNSSEGPVFINFGSFQYYFGPPVKDYEEAKIRCQSLNASLAVLNTVAIRDFISNESTSLDLTVFPYSFYFDLKRINDLNNDSGFAWPDGTLLSESVNNSNWNELEPDSQQDKCVIAGWIYNKEPLLPWYDVPCSSLSRFICERSLDNQRIFGIIRLIEQISLLPIGYLAALGIGFLLSLCIVAIVFQLLHLGKVRLELYESEERNKRQLAELERPLTGIHAAESKYFEPVAKVNA